MEPDKLNNNNGKYKFPRKLDQREKEILFEILPADKPGYKLYRDKIENLDVIGSGKFGDRNLILGLSENKGNIPQSSAPIFAAGTVFFKETEVIVSIHEEVDGIVEIDISPDDANAFLGKLTKIGMRSYSDWIPGYSAPYDNSELREIKITQNKYLLAIAPKHQKLWLYDYDSEVNHLIPVSNFYNSLMLVKGIRDSKIALNPNSLFPNLSKYSDDDLVTAFLSYNKYLRKFDIDYSLFREPKKEKKKTGFLNIFHKVKN